MIEIEYNLSGSGWANGKIGNGKKTIQFAVSYLNDSLKELAQSAIKISEKEFQRVVFMDEPGEHVLVLNRIDENSIDFELRWYKDWWSWNLVEEDNFQSILKGNTTVLNYQDQVKSILNGIMTKLSPEEYRKQWIEHDFPMAEFKKLSEN